MNTLQNEIIKIKKIYTELFSRSQEAIDLQLNALKTASLCNKCKDNCDIEFNKINLFQSFPDGCRYKFWQEAALNHLENKISKDVFNKIQEIEKYRKNFSCGKCASCCKLASSEYSYDELKERAKNGDKFSQEFISIFVPYDNIDEPRKIYPDYIALLEKKFEDQTQLHFYYCPKLGENGLCSDYENRPNICRDFPNNPLVALPLKCSFNKWKEDVEITALTLHALIDIVGFYKEKLKDILKQD